MQLLNQVRNGRCEPLQMPFWAIWGMTLCCILLLAGCEGITIQLGNSSINSSSPLQVNPWGNYTRPESLCFPKGDKECLHPICNNQGFCYCNVDAIIDCPNGCDPTGGCK